MFVVDHHLTAPAHSFCALRLELDILYLQQLDRASLYILTKDYIIQYLFQPDF